MCRKLLIALLPTWSFGKAYDQTLAIEYANIAGAAYCAKHTIKEWDCGPKCIKGLTSVDYCESDSRTTTFVGRWKDGCVISFEGTNGPKSVEVDLRAWRKQFGCDGCSVHAGFLAEWQGVKKCIVDKLTALKCSKTDPIRATGHSLGGGVSVIAMYDLRKLDGWNIAELYTFGMPRIGDYHFVTSFNEEFKGRFYRVTHGRDPFVHMPLGPIYKHVQPEIYYNGSVDEGFIQCDIDDDKNCTGQFTLGDNTPTSWHHEYVGIHTTQAECQSGSQPCGADIENSWCMYGVECNVDQRGPSHCHYGPLSEDGAGACRCDEGYCPTNGKCSKPNKALFFV